MVLPPLVLLVATYSLSMHALLQCTDWLDHPSANVRAAQIMSPAIAAAWCLWLLLAVVTLSALWTVPVTPSNDFDDVPQEPPSWETLSAQMPSLLVRESSTLFRQVSARTLHAYKLQYGQLVDECLDQEQGCHVPASSSSYGATGGSINASTVTTVSIGKGDVAVGESGVIEIDAGLVTDPTILEGAGCWICR